MNKVSVFLLICLFIIPHFSYAEEIQTRTYEFGVHGNFIFSNNFLSVSEIFSRTVALDVDNLSKGFKFNLGINYSPFFFNYNSQKGWGFGLFTNVEAIGILGFNNNMLSFNEAENEKSDLGGALFASIGIDSFFNYQNFKIKIRPSMYYTLAYLNTDISYTFLNSSDGTKFGINYDMYVYAIFPIVNIHENKFSGKPGIDLNIGVEYPLLKDIDAGLNFINIPIIASKLENYRLLNGRVGGEDTFNILEDGGMNDFINSLGTYNDIVTYGAEYEKIRRPFKMHTYVNWRPLGKDLFFVRPVLGFCHNKLYSKSFSLEAGINTGLNFSNLFIVTAGINYSDRMWINGIGFTINTRAVEINIGADMRSQDFLKSWTGNGIGLDIGFKFGW